MYFFQPSIGGGVYEYQHRHIYYPPTEEHLYYQTESHQHHEDHEFHHREHHIHHHHDHRAYHHFSHHQHQVQHLHEHQHRQMQDFVQHNHHLGDEQVNKEHHEEHGERQVHHLPDVFHPSAVDPLPAAPDLEKDDQTDTGGEYSSSGQGLGAVPFGKDEELTAGNMQPFAGGLPQPLPAASAPFTAFTTVRFPPLLEPRPVAQQPVPVPVPKQHDQLMQPLLSALKNMLTSSQPGLGRPAGH